MATPTVFADPASRAWPNFLSDLLAGALTHNADTVAALRLVNKAWRCFTNSAVRNVTLRLDRAGGMVRDQLEGALAACRGLASFPALAAISVAAVPEGAVADLHDTVLSCLGQLPVTALDLAALHLLSPASLGRLAQASGSGSPILWIRRRAYAGL